MQGTKTHSVRLHLQKADSVGYHPLLVHENGVPRSSQDAKDPHGATSHRKQSCSSQFLPVQMYAETV